MWYPATVTVAATSEPVSRVEAKRHVHAEDFADDDAYLESLISAVRDYAEKYCGAIFASQTLTIKATGWCDFAHLPVTPVVSITSIAYVDANGASQTLADTVYELRGDAVVLKYGQVWPAIQSGSLITVVAVSGYTACPPSVKHAMLLRSKDFYDMRESAGDANWSTFDSLLANYRFY